MGHIRPILAGCLDARLGIEPSFSGSEPAFLPIEDRAKVLADSRGLEPQPLRAPPLSKRVRRACPVDYPCGAPGRIRTHALSIMSAQL